MIHLEETKAYFFSTVQATDKKKSEIVDLAIRIRNAKKIMSVFTFLHFDYFFDSNMSKYEFYNYINSSLCIDLPSQVKTEAIEDVYDKYKQRRDNIKERILDLKITHYNKSEYYKKAVKFGDFTINKGAVKNVVYKHFKTEFTIFTTTMSLFFADSEEDLYQKFTSYADKKIEGIETDISELQSREFFKEEEIKAKENRLKSYANQKEHFEKMISYANNEIIFKACYELSRQRRERCMIWYKNPIEFKTLNFRGRSKVSVFLDKNRNSVKNFNKRGHNSVINAFLNFGGVINGRKYLYIPVKYSKSWHGSLKDYKKESESNTFNYQYQIMFDKNNNFKIQIGKKTDVEWYESEESMTVIGGDENMKHNLEQFSDGQSIDWPRKEIEELVELEIKLDKLNNNKKSLESKISFIKRNNESKPKNEKKSFRQEVSEIKQTVNEIKQLSGNEKEIQKTINGKIERSIAEILKNLQNVYGDGNVQISLENIDGKFRSNRHIKYKTESGLEYPQNKIFRLCHFGEIKDIFKRIGRKYRIPVSFVPSYYTSQICPLCGCIDRNNRKVQEDFKCVSCGAEAPADLKSSRIISVILASAVLRGVFLKQDETGAYVPKSGLNKDKVLKNLEKYSLEIVKQYAEMYINSDKNLSEQY